jgi:hypothetical protein
MRNRLRRGAALIALALIGCSSGPKILSDYDSDYAQKFTAYRTYDWMMPPRTGDARLDNKLTRTRIVGAIDRALAAKGYEKVDDFTPDFLIGYHVALQGKLDATTVNTWYKYSYPANPSGASGFSETYVREYQEGSLIVDIVDGEENELAWRGAMQTEIRDDLDPAKSQAIIAEAIASLLDEFPPQTD